jgi:hypothetical protein
LICTFELRVAGSSNPRDRFGRASTYSGTTNVLLQSYTRHFLQILPSIGQNTPLRLLKRCLCRLFDSFLSDVLGHFILYASLQIIDSTKKARRLGLCDIQVVSNMQQQCHTTSIFLIRRLRRRTAFFPSDFEDTCGHFWRSNSSFFHGICNQRTHVIPRNTRAGSTVQTMRYGGSNSHLCKYSVRTFEKVSMHVTFGKDSRLQKHMCSQRQTPRVACVVSPTNHNTCNFCPKNI